ncbi:MAG TPA: hypothetical protein PLJ25_00960 [Methanothrix sp.]|nr:hypothetical protein [Methanothrix sp.]
MARQAFDAASGRERAAILERVRKMALREGDARVIWAIHDYLSKKRKEMDEKYDFRYSQIRRVFGILLAEGWMKWEDLEGISPDKLDEIRIAAEVFSS